MIKIKKIISIYLAAIIMSACIPALTLSAEESDEQDYKIDLLEALEIIDTSERNENINSGITRGEFTKYLVYAYGLKDIAEGMYYEPVFSDVAEGDPYAREIGLASRMGLISGYENGTYSANATITANEAVTSVVCMLGFKYYAQAKGEYPTGYLAVANEIGLLKGISLSKDGFFTKSETFKLIYNALHCEMMLRETYSPNSNNIAYNRNKTTTLLQNQFGISIVKGILDGTDITRLFGGSNDILPFHVTIDGREFFCGDIAAWEHLGFSVEAYYKTGELLEKDTLIFIRRDGAKNKEEVLDVEDIVDISEGRITYLNKDDVERGISYDTGAAVIYNGVSTTYPLNKNLIPENSRGKIRLISNNGGKYNVFIMDVYSNYLVKSFNSTDYMLYDLLSNKSICLDPTQLYPYVELFNADGNLGSIADIKSFSTVTVFESKGDAQQPYIRAYISNKTIQGKVNSHERYGGGVIVNVGNTDYKLAGEFAKLNTMELTPGTEFEFALNAFGEISGMRFFSGSSERWGYILQMKILEDGMDSAVFAKIFTSDKAFNNYKLSDRVTIDDISYKNQVSDILTHMNTASNKITSNTDNQYYTQLVRFKTNNDNEITSIDTVLEDYSTPAEAENATSTNKLRHNNVASQYYYQNSALFGGQCMVDASTVIFICPSSANTVLDYKDEANYTVLNVSALRTASIFNAITAYYLGNSKIAADALVIDPDELYGVGKLPSASSYSMVDRITTVIDSNGNQCLSVYIYNDGNQRAVLADSSLKYTNEESKSVSVSNLNRGDIIIYSESPLTGKMNELRLGYSVKADKLVTYDGAFTSTKRLLLGYVYKTFPDGIILSKTNNANAIPSGEREAISKLTCAVMVYDSERDIIYSASEGSIDSYDAAGDKCSRIVINTSYADPKAVFIIK